MKRSIVFALVLALAACGKKKEEAPPAPPAAGSGSAMAAGSGSASGSGAGSATMAAAGSAVDVPTEVDFEDQAKTDLTDKNVEAKVKALEDDLGK